MRSPQWPNTFRYLFLDPKPRRDLVLFPIRFSKGVLKAIWFSGVRDLTFVVFLDSLAAVSQLRRITSRRRQKKEGQIHVAVFAEGKVNSGLSPAANYRVYKVARLFEQRNIHWEIIPAVPSKYHRVSPGYSGILHHWHEFKSRFMDVVLKAHRYYQIAWHCPVADATFLQRELMVSLSPNLELFARAMSPALFFDFDDALFAQQPWHDSKDAIMIANWQAQRNKIDRILSEADGVTASNDYLASYAKTWNDRIEIAPTPVDTDLFIPAKAGSANNRDPKKGIISWIGTSGNLIYVMPLIETILRAIRDTEPGWRFVIVCNDIQAAKKKELEAQGITFRVWDASREIADFQEADIGIMPLKDDEWSRGKMGYKLLQYLSCEIPVIASPVGYNAKIVTDRWGVLASSNEDWYRAIRQLIQNTELRSKMGEAGRKMVVENYGLSAFVTPVEKLIRRTLGAAP